MENWLHTRQIKLEKAMDAIFKILIKSRWKISKKFPCFSLSNRVFYAVTLIVFENTCTTYKNTMCHFYIPRWDVYYSVFVNDLISVLAALTTCTIDIDLVATPLTNHENLLY